MGSLNDLLSTNDLNPLDDFFKREEQAFGDKDKESIKLRGVLVATSGKHIGLLVSDRLVVIPKTAVRDASKEAAPANLPKNAVAVVLEVLKAAELQILHRIKAVELGTTTGVLPMALAKPSLAKNYAVPAAAVEARDIQRGLTLAASIDGAEPLDPWKTIVSDQGPQTSILTPLDMTKLSYSIGTPMEAKQTQIHDCPYDTVDTKFGIVTTSTDFRRDETVVSQTEFNTDVHEVKQPYTSVSTPFEQKSWKAINTSYETKKVTGGVSSKSQDISLDYSTEVSTSYNSDVKEVV